MTAPFARFGDWNDPEDPDKTVSKQIKNDAAINAKQRNAA